MFTTVSERLRFAREQALARAAQARAARTAASLARPSVVQMGSTLPTTNPPTRVAEEYGMIDTISGGRLVAGMPLGTAMDATLCAGITPIEQRERYYEAHDLILKSWTAPDVFAWNGKYFQLPMVNVWPANDCLMLLLTLPPSVIPSAPVA